METLNRDNDIHATAVAAVLYLYVAVLVRSLMFSIEWIYKLSRVHPLTRLMNNYLYYCLCIRLIVSALFLVVKCRERTSNRTLVSAIRRKSCWSKWNSAIAWTKRYLKLTIFALLMPMNNYFLWTMHFAGWHVQGSTGCTSTVDKQENHRNFENWWRRCSRICIQSIRRKECKYESKALVLESLFDSLTITLFRTHDQMHRCSFRVQRKCK